MAYFRVSQQGTLPQGDQWVSNLHVLSSSSLATVHTAVDSLIAAFWNNTFKALCNTGVTLDSVETVSLDPLTGKNQQAQVSSHAIAGGAVTATAPPQTAVLISYRTANAGKSGRGRQYFPCLAAANLQTTGAIVDATRDSIDTAWTAVISGLGPTHTAVILHGGFNGRDSNGKPTYVQLTHDAITGVAVAGVLATQRRRTNKVIKTYSPFLAV